MAENIPSTMEKALAINLDPLQYGTVVEIGAGQEVARWFFQAGGAAGTIAKTMSAYDMNFSDEIYGTSADRRYVSRARLERMLEYEFDLIVSRIEAHRPEGSRFFAFADTVTAKGYRKQDECHGWLGIRLQSSPKSAPDDIIVHVIMHDDTNVEQQDALGILGVNLVYGAFHYVDRPERFLRSLMDNLKWGRVEFDLVEFRGPTLGSIDNRLMALELVKASLTRAVLFDPRGNVIIPADALHRRSVIGMRGAFHPVTAEDTNMFGHAKARFLAQAGIDQDRTVFLAEMTMADLANDGEVDTVDFLSRVLELRRLGFHVLISEFYRYFRVRQFLARHTLGPVAIVMDVDGFANIMAEKDYEGLSGGLLEGLGQLFPAGTTAYVYPKKKAGKTVALDDVPVDAHLHPLVTYLRERGHIVPVDDFEL